MPKIPIIQSSNVANLVELRTLQPRTGAVNSLAFSPDSSILALGCSDDKIELWRVNDGALLSTLPFGWPGAEGVAFNTKRKHDCRGERQFSQILTLGRHQENQDQGRIRSHWTPTRMRRHNSLWSNNCNGWFRWEGAILGLA
jgi:WD40 repeat protein